MPPYLTFSIIKFWSRVKWSNLRKGITHSPTPWCSSYRKGILGVIVDYGRQLYFTLYMYKQDLALNNPATVDLS